MAAPSGDRWLTIANVADVVTAVVAVSAVGQPEGVYHVGAVDELIRNGMTVSQVNLQKYEQIPDGLEAITKIRYRDQGTLSQIHQLSDHQVEVEFLANVRGVAPGQSAVFYEGDDVIGGGIIHGGFLKDRN